MDRCSRCTMPMQKGQECTCDPKCCFHCCGCDKSCACGCAKKEENDKKNKKSGCCHCGK